MGQLNPWTTLRRRMSCNVPSEARGTSLMRRSSSVGSQCKTLAAAALWRLTFRLPAIDRRDRQTDGHHPDAQTLATRSAASVDKAVRLRQRSWIVSRVTSSLTSRATRLPVARSHVPRSGGRGCALIGTWLPCLWTTRASTPTARRSPRLAAGQVVI